MELIFIIISLALLIMALYLIKTVKKALPVGKSEYSGLNDLLNLAAGIIETAAAASVGKLEQTIGKELREKIAAGQAQREELFNLAEEAYQEVLSALPEDVYMGLSKGMANVEQFIRNKMETELLKLKNSLK